MKDDAGADDEADDDDEEDDDRLHRSGVYTFSCSVNYVSPPPTIPFHALWYRRDYTFARVTPSLYKHV